MGAQNARPATPAGISPEKKHTKKAVRGKKSKLASLSFRERRANGLPVRRTMMMKTSFRTSLQAALLSGAVAFVTPALAGGLLGGIGGGLGGTFGAGGMVGGTMPSTFGSVPQHVTTIENKSNTATNKVKSQSKRAAGAAQSRT